MKKKLLILCMLFVSLFAVTGSLLAQDYDYEIEYQQGQWWCFERYKTVWIPISIWLPAHYGPIVIYVPIEVYVGTVCYPSADPPVHR